MTKKSNWLAFNIRFPDELIPLYDFLQDELNYFLFNKTLRRKIENINYNQHKGNVWREMNTTFKSRINTWKIKNKAWYARMFFENIRREVQSKRENIIIYSELENNNFKIDENLFATLVNKYRIYATRGRISNLKNAGTIPVLPNFATFQLDYTVSDKQNFILDDNNLCKIQIIDGNWIDYQILLPASLNGKLTGKVAKPRFMKRKSDGQYIGICSYEYIPEDAAGDSILGVDIGQIKLFSAVALHKSGKYSEEYIQSRSLYLKNKKLKRLYNKKTVLYNKINRIKAFKNKKLDKKLYVLETEYGRIKGKLISLKKEIARLVAKEVIQVAKLEQCNEIHIENLTWLNSQGGKWNHSETHKYIEEAGLRAGIKVIKVNAAYTSSEHPITKERGIKSNRTITFVDNKTIDRDVLGAINIAVRNKGKKKNNKIIKLKNQHKTPKRVKPDKSKKRKVKELIKNFKKNTQIVVFSPQSSLNETVSNELWALMFKDQPNSSLLPRLNHDVSICINY